MNKKIVIILILLASYAYASSSRYSLKFEYRLVNACIDYNTFGGVSKELRDKCIERVLLVEKLYPDEWLITSMSKENQEKLFELN